MKKIIYWSPYLGHIGTKKSTFNSAKSLSLYGKGKFDVKLVNAVGEWSSTKDINTVNFFNNIYNLLPKGGFIKSRFSYSIIFLLSIIPLYKLLKKNKPDYLIAHLITSLPIFLFRIFNFKTKLILRISGYPKLNFTRKFLWKFCSKKIHIVTCPSKELREQLNNSKIFDEKKIIVLYDSVINIQEVNNKKKIPLEKSLSKIKYFLAIGRLTKQKNFGFLIDCFNELIKKDNSINLVIIGEGEDYITLKKKIDRYNLKQNIFLIGFKNNVFKYLKKCEAFILSSLWEDPGFVIVEAMYSNSFVISSNCESGPKEIISNHRGILFKNNSKDDFIEKFSKFIQLDNKERIDIKLNAKKFTKEFSLLKHFKRIENILS